MRKYLAIAMLGALALAATPAQAQKKVTFGHQQVFDIVPVLLAQEKGFFAKHGIEVALKPIPLNSQNPAALEAGEVDIAMPTASVLLQAINGGLDIVAVAGFSDTVKTDSNYGILVRPEAGIKAPADFIGKKVGVPGLNAFLHVMFREWLTLKGVDWKKVEFVETQFPQMEGKRDPDHGSVWTSTETTAGRSRTMGAQLSPALADTYTCPPVVPKYTPHGSSVSTAIASRNTLT